MVGTVGQQQSGCVWLACEYVVWVWVVIVGLTISGTVSAVGMCSRLVGWSGWVVSLSVPGCVGWVSWSLF